MGFSDSIHGIFSYLSDMGVTSKVDHIWNRLKSHKTLINREEVLNMKWNSCLYGNEYTCLAARVGFEMWRRRRRREGRNDKVFASFILLLLVILYLYCSAFCFGLCCFSCWFIMGLEGKVSFFHLFFVGQRNYFSNYIIRHRIVKIIKFIYVESNKKMNRLRT